MTPNIYRQGQIRYIRVSEIPKKLRDRFIRFCAGIKRPTIHGNTCQDAVFASDYLDWLDWTLRDKPRWSNEI